MVHIRTPSFERCAVPQFKLETQFQRFSRSKADIIALSFVMSSVIMFLMAVFLPQLVVELPTVVPIILVVVAVFDLVLAGLYLGMVRHRLQ